MSHGGPKWPPKTAKSDAAHRLIQGVALVRQRMLESSLANIVIRVAEEENTQEDIASRAITHIDDDNALLTHFDALFP